jgi:type II secretory pathway predicted ATPase ExeA
MIAVNPFSGIGLPRKDLIFWADRHRFREELMEFLKSMDNSNVRTMVLLGDYGAGKTHALLFSQITCEQSNPPIPVVYISSPGNSFVELFKKIIEELGFEKIVLTFDTLISRSKERILTAIEKATPATDELRHIESISTERIIRRSFPYVDSDLATVLAQVYNDRNLDLCRSWLMGRNLTKAEMSKLNVSKSITLDENAQSILGDLLKIFISSGQQIVLLIDEFEDIGNLSKSGALDFSKAFRKFIDQNIAGLKIIIAWTYTSYQQFMEDKGPFRGKTYEALRDRLQYNVERLQPLKGDDLVDFISDTISRIDDRNLDEFIELKAIRFLGSQIKELQPRQVNVVLNRAFQIAIEKSQFPIDMRLINEAFLQTGIKQATPGKVA